MLVGREEQFKAIYTQELAEAVKNDPKSYCWDVSQLHIVVDKMMKAIKQNSYNKDSVALKNTCKKLGIKYTYTAIKAYLEGK